MSDESEIVEAVTGLVKAVPVYEDLLQPAAQELGKSLKTITKTINMALSPFNMLVFGYEQIEAFISEKVASRLKNVPPENIITPKPNVAGPIIESLRYTGNEPSLSDLYANLLATAMDKETANKAHPAFAEIIKQLTPDEAKLIGLFIYKDSIPFPLLNVKYEWKTPTEERSGSGNIIVNFSLLGIQAGVEFPELTPTYIDNLCRLGLAEIPPMWAYTGKDIYADLENALEVQNKKTEIENNPEWKCIFERKALHITELGKQFANTCVTSKN